MSKFCNTCKIIKEDTEFSRKKHASGNYGLQSRCKACVRDMNKRRYASESEQDRTKRIAKAKEWKAGNRDKVLSLKRKYRVIKKTDRLSSVLHEQHVIAYERYWADYQAQLDKKAAEPHDRHVKDWIGKQKNLYLRWKYKHDIEYMLYQRLKRGVQRGLGDRMVGSGWFSSLDYNMQELREHIERQFTEGMSWENAGEWHIDHILPICSFGNLEVGSDAFKACYALDNLMPVWPDDNREKYHTFDKYLIT